MITLKHRFQVITSLNPDGSVHWRLMSWDAVVARAIGDGWVRTFREGSSRDRETAALAARQAAEDYVWRIGHPDEIVAEFEITEEVE